MKRAFLWSWAVILAVLFLLPASAHAVLFDFFNITNNNPGDAAIGEAQLSVDVTAVGSTQVNFQFFNVGPNLASITDVYFDDGNLLGIASVNNGSGVDFAQLASPPDLPGGNTVTPDPFVVTAGFSADSEPPAQPNGVNPGETLGIVFDLQPTTDFDDVLAALALGGADGGLRIGIHVQGFASGGSESFVNNPPEGQPPVPEPATMLLVGTGLVGLAGYGRKVFRK